MRVYDTSQTGVQLLQNRDFELGQDGKISPWWAWGKGFAIGPRAGRNGSQAVQCENSDTKVESGISQTLQLNQTNIAPFVIRGWSKAEDVTGSPDNGYSLYVDVTYMDGTALWGHAASFRCGTHDWEQRQFMLLPEKPVKSFTLHCLFRWHTGKVWFDDASVEEIRTPAGSVLFHAKAVAPVICPERKKTKPQKHLKTKDGLGLMLANGAVTALRDGRKDLAGNAPSGFLVRDFATGSDYHAFTDNVCADLRLTLSNRWQANRDHITVQGRITDITGKDRALTLVFALPIEAAGWQWGDDVRSSRTIQGISEFASTIAVKSGSGRMSKYPFGAIWNKENGLALGLNMAYPAQYTVAYNPGTRQLFIAYDVALLKETEKFPSSAEFSFVIFRFDPHWGFRSALQKYYDIFSEDFARRVPREGIWMPFADINNVPRFEDFGFAFQEGAPNVGFDDQHGILSFVYVEPMSHWLPLPAGTPRTDEAALEVIKKDASGDRDPEKKQMAAATLTSGIHRADGHLSLYLVKAPWCDGGVYTLNPDPDLTTTEDLPFTKATTMQVTIENAFKKNQPATNSNAPGAGLDGVYFDSLEMSCMELNYRREHFRAADFPLVYDFEGRPAQMMIFNTLEFVRSAAKEMHARNRFTFANAVLWNFSLPAPMLDVLGTEVNWMPTGNYSPDGDALMSFRRALCRQKPYCLLMNTDYSKFTPDYVESYFNRCLFYGIWPGFFDQEAAFKDPYWGSGRKWYERDRALFKRYIPLLREITSAGWEPVTGFVCDNPRIWLERFGKGSSGRLFITVFNDTAETQQGVISSASGDAKSRAAGVHVIQGEPVEKTRAGWHIKVPPQRATLLEFRR